MSARVCPPPPPPSVWCWGPDSGYSAWSGETKCEADVETIAWNGECAPLAGPLQAFAAGSAAKFGWAASSSRAFWKIGFQNKGRIMSQSLDTHFPTELNQCRKFDQRSDICFLKPKKVYKKTSLTVKSNNLGFWSNIMSKLRNFETRFEARDTWPCVIWGYQWIALM